MYFTGIVNSAYHWSRRFFPFGIEQLFFPFKLAFIYVLYFSFLCINVFEIKLFNAVKSIRCPYGKLNNKVKSFQREVSS